MGTFGINCWQQNDLHSPHTNNVAVVSMVLSGQSKDTGQLHTSHGIDNVVADPTILMNQNQKESHSDMKVSEWDFFSLS